MSTYAIQVDHQKINLSTEDIASLDMHQSSASHIHVLKSSKAFDVQVETHNTLKKTMTLTVNGNRYEVKIEDEYDMMVAQMGLLEKTEALSNNITAPMPGYIIDILVQPGDHIEADTPLFVLSAMKMENVILSSGKGIVKTIEVKQDDSVVKGQLIIEMES